MDEKLKIAMFIDADNAPASRINYIMGELASYGVVNIRRAYGNWTSDNLKSWVEILHDNSIQPVQQFDLTKRKNASDIALVIDVMDVLHNKDVDVVCLVTSDCDFTPLARRVREDGKLLLGFGERKAPAAFVDACSRFLFLDEEGETTQAKPSSPKNLKSDTKLINLLRQGIEAMEDEDGWARLSAVGNHISNQASFDPRNYGFKKLSDLFAAIDLFELKKVGSLITVRDKKRGKAVK
jgi:uncharacterized protein (TIGR00288 family)